MSVKPKTGGVIPQRYSVRAPESHAAGFEPAIYRTCYFADSAKNRSTTSTSARPLVRCYSACVGYQPSDRGYTLR